MENLTPKLNELKEVFKNNFIELLKTYGEKWQGVYELETFEYCSEYGCMLNDSTIDKITWDGYDILFYYNENDYDYFVEFSYDDLAYFFDSLLDAIQQESIKNNNY